jgi:hypothetical protein
MKSCIGERNGKPHGQEIHGTGLAFRNEKRPSARFLYFNFIVALLRIKIFREQAGERPGPSTIRKTSCQTWYGAALLGCFLLVDHSCKLLALNLITVMSRGFP